MYQKVTIIGNLGGDPSLRYMPDGTPVSSFSVGTNRKWKSNGEQREETVWFRVSAWRNLAEICHRYLKKGQQVFIEGRLTPDQTTGGPRIWEDGNGEPRASYELTALEVKFLGGKAHQDDEPEQPRRAARTEEDDANIPF